MSKIQSAHPFVKYIMPYRLAPPEDKFTVMINGQAVSRWRFGKGDVLCQDANSVLFWVNEENEK
jgi:hypothetical protein